MGWFIRWKALNNFCAYLAYVASVSVRFRSKERGTRVKDRAKNGALALVSFLARPKPRITFLVFHRSETKRKHLLRRLAHTVRKLPLISPTPPPVIRPSTSDYKPPPPPLLIKVRSSLYWNEFDLLWRFEALLKTSKRKTYFDQQCYSLYLSTLLFRL